MHHTRRVDPASVEGSNYISMWNLDDAATALHSRRCTTCRTSHSFQICWTQLTVKLYIHVHIAQFLLYSFFFSIIILNESERTRHSLLINSKGNTLVSRLTAFESRRRTGIRMVNHHLLTFLLYYIKCTKFWLCKQWYFFFFFNLSLGFDSSIYDQFGVLLVIRIREVI